MMRSRYIVPALGLVSWSLLAVACTDAGDPEPGGEGGAAGDAPSKGGSGTSGSKAAGGDDGGGSGGVGAGGECATEGVGTLVIEVSGLPAGVDPDIDIDGPEALNATEEGPLEGVAAGNYEVSAGTVFDEDPIVRTAFAATVTTRSLCLTDGGSQTIKVEYDAIPSSNQLWMPGRDPELVAFSSADLKETGMVAPSSAIETPGVGSGAFDKDGNLWAAGTTIGEDMLLRFPAASLGERGTGMPDIRITLPEIECFPAINHIAFDPNGNLWLSACEDQLHRIAAADLKTSGDKVSDVLFTEVINNSGIAFDRAGNLWVTGPTLLRFDAARLETSDTDPADLEISVEHALAKTVLGADEIAFDKAGNLWGVAGFTVYQLAAADLDGTGNPTVKANVSFDLDVAVLPSTPAFDESNALWISLADGTFGSYGVAKLAMSKPAGTGVAPDVRITTDAVTSGLPLAFFPAPQGLPLFHSIPGE